MGSTNPQDINSSWEIWRNHAKPIVEATQFGETRIVYVIVPNDVMFGETYLLNRIALHNWSLYIYVVYVML
jgi:hypothetical protein